jgi:cytosine/adenosine deaminase-related metal-dependent hydrolase
MQPIHDPLRNLIHCAAERAIRDVYVDGQAVVKDRRVVKLDYDGAVRELQDAQKRACRRAEQDDPQGRSPSSLAPFSLPLAR